MAYLKSFKRLLASKKILRLLSTKLRLHKLQRSKPTSRKIKKRPTTTATTKSGSGWLSLPFQSRFKRKRKDIQKYRPRKKTKPVYVDQLFLDKKQEIPVIGERRLIDNAVAGSSSSSSSKTGGGVATGADDMWESLVMGSAQMDGINERAEEFISRFRADLLAQEITARRF